MKLFKHSKTGVIYEILFLSQHSETKEDLVNYRRYNPKNDCRISNVIWSRPLEGKGGFSEQIDVNGKSVVRFVPLSLLEIKELMEKE